MNEFTLEESEAIIEAAARGEVLEAHRLSGEMLTSLHAPGQALGSAPSIVSASSGVAGRIARRSAVAASVAVLGMASVAAAATGPLGLLGDDEPVETLLIEDDVIEDEVVEDGDTVLNFGYDEESQLFVWNTSSTEGDHDCSLEKDEENPAYGTRYGVDGEDITVDGLTIEGDDVAFPARDGESEDVAYAEAVECALGATEVAGPNGQINHGMFMKAFNSLYEGTGRGCINRHLAQSDLGKGDQQVRVSDVDPEFVSVADGDEGEVTFSTILAECERDNGNENGRGNGNANGHRQDGDEDPAIENDVDEQAESPGNGNGNKGNGNGNGNENGNGRNKGNGNGSGNENGNGRGNGNKGNGNG
jgi:hypothetical protein